MTQEEVAAMERLIAQTIPNIIADDRIPIIEADNPVNFTIGDVLRMAYGVANPYRARSVFVVNPITDLSLRMLKDSKDVYLWQPTKAGSPSTSPNTLIGWNLYTYEEMPDKNDAPAIVMVFGDLKAYSDSHGLNDHVTRHGIRKLLLKGKKNANRPNKR